MTTQSRGGSYKYSWAQDTTVKCTVYAFSKVADRSLTHVLRFVPIVDTLLLYQGTCLDLLGICT